MFLDGFYSELFMEYLKNNIKIKNTYLFFIIFISAIIKLIICLSFHPNTLTWPDEKDYITITQNVEIKNEYYINMLGGYKYNFFRPPGYIFFLIFFRIFTKSIFMIKLIQIIISSLSLYFLYKITQIIFKIQYISNITLSVAALHPLSLYFPSLILSETLTIILILFLCLIYLKNNINLLMNILFGLLSGYLILIKPEYIIFIFGVLFFVKIRKIIIGTIFILLIILPWLYRNYRVYNSISWISSNSGYMFWLGNRNDIVKYNFKHPLDETAEMPNDAINLTKFNELEVQKKLFKITLKELNNKSLLSLFYHKLLFMWIYPLQTSTNIGFINKLYKIIAAIYYYLLLLFGFIGLFFSYKSKNKYLNIFSKFVLSLFITIFINGLIFLPRGRYRYPFEYIFIIFTSYGISQFFHINIIQNSIKKVFGGNNVFIR